jgi:hypothetical protein
VARKPSARVVLARGALDQATLAVADGLFEAGKRIIEAAGPKMPDSPYDPFPAGEGLPKQGGVLAYVGNKKVAGWSIRGPQPKKPRSARATTKEHSVVVLAGFGFPARFNEGGTINQPPRPVLTPELRAQQGGIPGVVGDIARPQINGAR